MTDIFEVGQRKPIFFLHIPKTAGMSLRAYIHNQYRSTDVFPAETWPDAVRAGAAPCDYRLVQGHFYYNMRQCLSPDTPVMTVLREPLTRTLSALRHMHRDPHFQLHDMVAGRDVRQLLRDPAIMGAQADVQASALCASAPPGEVLDYLARARPNQPGAEASDLEDPPSLELALQRLEHVEFLGIMDDLSSHVMRLADAMGYHPVPRLALVNAAPGATTTLDGLDPEDLEILRAHNRIDLELYERAVGLVAVRGLKRALLSLTARGIYVCPPGPFALDLGGPIPGFGWYEAERDGDVAWRWTGPEQRFTIEICLQRSVCYTGEIGFGTVEGYDPASLSLRVNGVGLPLTLERSEDGSVLARWRIPASLTERHDGCCQIAFDTGPTRRSGHDIRPLGISVGHLAFAPVGAAATKAAALAHHG